MAQPRRTHGRADRRADESLLDVAPRARRRRATPSTRVAGEEAIAELDAQERTAPPKAHDGMTRRRRSRRRFVRI